MVVIGLVWALGVALVVTGIVQVARGRVALGALVIVAGLLLLGSGGVALYPRAA